MLHTRSRAEPGSMPRSINRQLMDFNSRLLSDFVRAGHHQLMVETMAARLRQLIESEDLSYDKFGEIAGVSAQAVGKWMKGGDVKEASVQKLASHFKVTATWIRYGGAEKGQARESLAPYSKDLTPIALDVATRWMKLSPERQEAFRDMIFTTSYVEERFPSMKRGRPKGESYDNLETAFEKDMQRKLRQLSLKLE